MAGKISEAKGTSRRLIVGTVTGFFMMLISYLMDGYGLMKKAEAYTSRPLWVYVLCLIIAMIGVPAMCYAFTGWHRILIDVNAKKWVKYLFTASAASYAISSLYIIGSDCLPPIIVQNAAELGTEIETAVRLAEKVQMYFMPPVIVFFLIEDIGISIVLWQLIFSGKLQLPKIMLVCCPAVTLAVDIALKTIPNGMIRDISVTLESLGWLLFMLAGYVHKIKKTEDT